MRKKIKDNVPGSIKISLPSHHLPYKNILLITVSPHKKPTWMGKSFKLFRIIAFIGVTTMNTINENLSLVLIRSLLLLGVVVVSLVL